jgi:radical SAM-linked protein
LYIHYQYTHLLRSVQAQKRKEEMEPPQQPEEPSLRQRVRLVYEKGEAIKFISHQDEFRLWERTLRRANLPLLYKQGFNPQPHIQFASPLGVGFTGVREPLDIVLSPSVPLVELQRRIIQALPPGVTLHRLEDVPLKADALQSQLIGADYTILIYAAPDELGVDDLERRIHCFLSEQTIWRERERKGQPYRYNLRPLVFELRHEGYAPDEEVHHIFLRVQQRAGATGRPDEVVNALGLDNFARTLRRDRLYIASQPADATLFAKYPVVKQEEISQPLPSGKRRRRDHAPAPHIPQGRSISQRAGDEFV